MSSSIIIMYNSKISFIVLLILSTFATTYAIPLLPTGVSMTANGLGATTGTIVATGGELPLAELTGTINSGS
ncbi:6223_t:CDS:2 [Ambispora leptoticha]|uniref:6223_t:CDS:1 n=1 Tax=Ambispora leptoticha TaxID=144679 RepID=A0A9N8ZBC1_9GLOM|nr:6223_t:CDS:2 [Ambispora leptoticha]